jgi:glycosyltransferase involved in cell wall biosynthesis
VLHSSTNDRVHALGAEAPRRILVVEMGAHEQRGHYPVAFAELATELLALGCDVEILTRRGWSLANDPSFPALRVHRLGRPAELAYRWAARLHKLPPRAIGQGADSIARAVVIVAATQRLARRARCSDVIMFPQVDALVTAVVARRGRWLSYQFVAPHSTAASSPADHPARGERVARWIGRRARDVAARLVARRRHLRVVTNVDSKTRAWADAAPYLSPVTIPFVGVRDRAPIGDARAALDLPEGERIALWFGGNPSKDAEVVWQAFTRLPDWRLVVGGGRTAASYRSWAAEASPGGAPAILFDGYADEETRGRLFAAADAVVLAYRRTRPPSDSGTLVDAIAWGRTIVCSDGCPSAEVVRRHGLGPIFEPGDVDSLVDAMRRVPRDPDPNGLAAARAELSARRIAQANLDALDALDAVDAAGDSRDAPASWPLVGATSRALRRSPRPVPGRPA